MGLCQPVHAHNLGGDVWRERPVPREEAHHSGEDLQAQVALTEGDDEQSTPGAQKREAVQVQAVYPPYVCQSTQCKLPHAGGDGYYGNQGNDGDLVDEAFALGYVLHEEHWRKGTQAEEEDGDAQGHEGPVVQELGGGVHVLAVCMPLLFDDSHDGRATQKASFLLHGGDLAEVFGIDGDEKLFDHLVFLWGTRCDLQVLRGRFLKDLLFGVSLQGSFLFQVVTWKFQRSHEACASHQVESQGSDDEQAAVKAKQHDQLILNSGIEEPSHTGACGREGWFSDGTFGNKQWFIE